MESNEIQDTPFERIYDRKYLCTFPNDSIPFNTVYYLSVCLDVTIIEPIYYHYGCTRSKYVCTIFNIIT